MILLLIHFEGWPYISALLSNDLLNIYVMIPSMSAVVYCQILNIYLPAIYTPRVVMFQLWGAFFLQ